MKFAKIAAALGLAGLAVSGIAHAQSALVKVDGSSTVYPITEAVAEDYQKSKQNQIRVTVGISGTGGGFKKFCRGETDVSNASRPISKKEIADCKAAGVQFIELPIAYDALTVVVNPKNTWARTMTVAQLKAIWEPAAQGKITNWKQVNPEWPDRPLKLYGPGADSGTFEYFTEAVNGKAKSTRGDFTASEDDNVLVQGVSRDIGGLGYFGYAYYIENKDKLQAVAVAADGKTAVDITVGANDTLSDIAGKINGAKAGVTATIVSDASGERLLLRSQTTGEESGFRMTVTDADGNNADGAGLSRLMDNATTSYAADAKATVNGIAVTSATNTFTNTVSGVTFNALKETTGPVEITVAGDTSKVKENLDAFVKAYNALRIQLNALTRFDTANPANSGALAGDVSTKALMNQVTDVLGQAMVPPLSRAS